MPISPKCRLLTHSFVGQLKLTEKEQIIGAEIIKEINERLNFLKSVGLGYLTLSRSSGTLSGGESQRIRLATQIGSSLMGVLYILDEPSIGLHQRDNEKLLATLKRLRDLGNTVIVVEHDEDTMYAADCIVDVGPGAGIHGGEIVCVGDVEKIKQCPINHRQYLFRANAKFPFPKSAEKATDFSLKSEERLKITLKISMLKFRSVNLSA